MGYEYLISICMMVKDEEKNLKRCLDSLGQLIEKRDVELIIVDTGSSDNTVNIAGQYTEKLFFHEWTNHFSEMRNITISYAKGEFILILDADEVIQDPLQLYKDIAENRKHANTLTCRIKNFTANRSFTLIQQERVFRNDGDFRYDGSVHNQPVYKAPIVNTNVYFDHYGYLFGNKEIRERKFIRTGGILKAELKKNPDNPYYRFQLAKTYSTHEDMTEALEEIRRAYRLIVGKPQIMKQAIFIYGAYALISLQNNEYTEAIKVSKEGLLLQPEFIDLYYIMAVSLSNLDKKQESMEAYLKYIDLASRYDTLSISTNPHVEVFFLGQTFLDNALFFIANEYYSSQKYDEVYDTAIQISDKEKGLLIAAKALLKLERFTDLADLIEKKATDNDLKGKIVSTIEGQIVNYSTTDKKRVESEFRKGKDIYSSLNKHRLGLYADKPQQIDKLIRETDFNELPDYYAEFFLDVDKRPRPVISAIKKMGKAKIKQYLNKMIDMKGELKEFFEDYVAGENVREDDYNSLRVSICILFVLLFREAAETKNSKIEVSEKYSSLFKLYIERGISYVNLLYKAERLRLYYSTLDESEDRFFVTLNYAMASIEEANIKTAIRYYSEAAKNNQYMACYMKKHMDDLFPHREGVQEFEKND